MFNQILLTTFKNFETISKTLSKFDNKTLALSEDEKTVSSINKFKKKTCLLAAIVELVGCFHTYKKNAILLIFNARSTNNSFNF